MKLQQNYIFSIKKEIHNTRLNKIKLYSFNKIIYNTYDYISLNFKLVKTMKFHKISN